MAELEDLLRQEARLLEERSDIDIRIALLKREQATKLGQIGASEVELSTARKRREPHRPVVQPAVDDLTRRRALKALRKVPS